MLPAVSELTRKGVHHLVHLGSLLGVGGDLGYASPINLGEYGATAARDLAARQLLLAFGEIQRRQSEIPMELDYYRQFLPGVRAQLRKSKTLFRANPDLTFLANTTEGKEVTDTLWKGFLDFGFIRGPLRVLRFNSRRLRKLPHANNRDWYATNLLQQLADQGIAAVLKDPAVILNIRYAEVCCAEARVINGEIPHSSRKLSANEQLLYRERLQSERYQLENEAFQSQHEFPEEVSPPQHNQPKMNFRNAAFCSSRVWAPEGCFDGIMRFSDRVTF